MKPPLYSWTAIHCLENSPAQNPRIRHQKAKGPAHMCRALGFFSIQDIFFLNFSRKAQSSFPKDNIPGTVSDLQKP